MEINILHSKPVGMKLIRDKIIDRLKLHEWEVISDTAQLNKLYTIKVIEELLEIIDSDMKDILEFADLIEVAYAFAKMNGFSAEEINMQREVKNSTRGIFSNIVLNNLNPTNKSNKIYLQENE